MTKDDTIKLLEISSKILEIIDDQRSEFENDDGVDKSMTRGDLQGVIEAQVMTAYLLGQKSNEVIQDKK